MYGSESTVGKRVGKCKTKRQPHSIHPPQGNEEATFLQRRKPNHPKETKKAKLGSAMRKRFPYSNPLLVGLGLRGGWGGDQHVHPWCVVCRPTDQEDRAHFLYLPVGPPESCGLVCGFDWTGRNFRNGTQPTGLVSVVWQVLDSLPVPQVFDLANSILRQFFRRPILRTDSLVLAHLYCILTRTGKVKFNSTARLPLKLSTVVVCLSALLYLFFKWWLHLHLFSLTMVTMAQPSFVGSASARKKNRVGLKATFKENAAR